MVVLQFRPDGKDAPAFWVAGAGKGCGASGRPGVRVWRARRGVSFRGVSRPPHLNDAPRPELASLPNPALEARVPRPVRGSRTRLPAADGRPRGPGLSAARSSGKEMTLSLSLAAP